MTVREAIEARPDLNPLMAIAVSHDYRPERSRKHHHLNGNPGEVMRELDRLIRKAGGTLVRIGRHRVYELDGERISLHTGTKLNSQQVIAIRSQVRRILRNRCSRSET